MDIGALWDELEDSLIPLLGEFRSRLAELDITRKPDHTLLSEADIAVQEHIVSRILAIDPNACIVAEEVGATSDSTDPNTAQHVWIIDPIDGTSQFVLPDRTEYCSVVCLLEDRVPVAALVVAPEIGINKSAVCVRVSGAGQPIEVNGHPVHGVSPNMPLRASLTRSERLPPSPVKPQLITAGFELKTSTTSTTLDMVRTCVDLSAITSPILTPFSLLFRESQKVWDGAAGICLAHALNLFVSDRNCLPRKTIDLDLSVTVPLFESTLVAWPAVSDEILSLFHASNDVR